MASEAQLKAAITRLESQIAGEKDVRKRTSLRLQLAGKQTQLASLKRQG
jgi:hypothetical protein